MKSLLSMTPVERIEDILQICHGLTIADIEAAVHAFQKTEHKNEFIPAISNLDPEILANNRRCTSRV